MLTVKALSPDKTVMGEVDGVYGPAGDSSLYKRGTAGKPGGNREDKHQPVPLGEPGLLTKSWPYLILEHSPGHKAESSNLMREVGDVNSSGHAKPRFIFIRYVKGR